jgi:hypothetical protein
MIPTLRTSIARGVRYSHSAAANNTVPAIRGIILIDPLIEEGRN